MNHDYQPTEFSRTLHTSVFASIIATFVNLIYNFIYRGIEGFYPSEIINVSSLIFMTMIVFTIAGLLFFMLSNYVKKGNPVEIVQFRGLLLGTVALKGVMLPLLVPYLAKHSSSYV